tara:strand:+ start:31 stop:1431 length:1401 start_codon:yes stop_codon:yes gene_type:complete
LAALVALAGCSVIVDPDVDSLGREDAGTPTADGGPDMALECVGGCDDGVECTVDQCVGGRCLQAADDSLCGDGERCDSVMGCVSNRCTSDADCGDDGVDCNGVSACGPDGMCVTSPALPCDDMDPCTEDFCGPTGCEATPVDADGDGAPAMSVDGTSCGGGTDCDDGDAGRNPDAAEVCDMVDQDCDGSVDEGIEGCGPTATGDTCADVIVLTFDASGTATFTGNLDASVGDDYDTECDADGGSREMVFAVDIDGMADLEVDTIGSGFDTVLAAGTSCGSFQLGGRGCNDDIDPGTTLQSRLWVHRVGTVAIRTRVFFLVSGYDDGAGGPVTLTVRRRNAISDTCDGPLDITGGGSVIGFAGGIENPTGQNDGSCQTFSERFDPEGAFVLEPARQRLRLRAYTDAFSPVVYVRLQCEDADDLICDRDGRGITSIDQDIPLGFLPMDVNVFVDGAGNGDAYTLDYRP